MNSPLKNDIYETVKGIFIQQINYIPFINRNILAYNPRFYRTCVYTGSICGGYNSTQIIIYRDKIGLPK